MGTETLTVEQIGVQFEELTSRQYGGISVSLLMREVVPPEFKVEVVDHKNYEGFSINVDEDEKPSEVYKHPYIYAARKAVEATFEYYQSTSMGTK